MAEHGAMAARVLADALEVDAPQMLSSPSVLQDRREDLLQFTAKWPDAWPDGPADTFEHGFPVSGDARVHYEVAVLRGFVEPPTP